MINLSDKLTAKTIDHVVADSHEIEYEKGKTTAKGNTVADELTNLAQQVRTISNNEFLIAFIDGLENLLGGIKRDGTWYIPTGIPTDVQTELDTLKDSTSKLIRLGDSDYAWAICDEDENVFLAGKHDGSVYIGKGVPEDVQTLINDINVQITSIQDKLENIEFDEEKNIVINNGVSSKEGFKLYTQEVGPNHSDSNILFSISDKNGNLICTAWKDASFEFENLKVINDIIVNKDLSVKGSFSATTIHADGIALSKVGLTEFEQALRENGFTGELGDWSTASSLHIPEPHCAMINITSANGRPYSWPTSKFVNNKVWVEFYDMQGNYFKKRAIHNAQGSSSLGFIKKNGAFDFCNDEWIGDDTFSIKFGDWVYQDSFHAKAYYTDFFKGASVVAYKIADQVEKSRGIFNDRPWKKALLKDYVFGSDQANSAQINDMTLQLNNEAKCHPDGFPCIIYLDGEFYGIYAFCIKKHRDNYHMKKDVAEHVHLDGELYARNLWQGMVNWTQFEIRNPKNLYYKEAHNGTFEYDADVAQAEIAGDDEVNAWIAAGQLPDGTEITSKIKKRLQTTAKVKNYIINLSQRINQIKAASTTEDKKALFEAYFDVDNLVDYEIVQMATGDTDGFGKNWQWTTYDGVKWWVNEYDKDMSFGGYFAGMFTQLAPTTGGWMGNDSNQPIGQLISLYKTEIKNRWKYLVDKGIINVDNFLGMFNDWLDRIGTNNFEKEYGKWVEAPCNRDDKVDTVHWKRTNNITHDTSLVDYDNTKTYMPGETCYYDLKNGWSGQFVCISETTGNPPLTGFYSNSPHSLGYRDSIWRLSNYISQRLEKENDFINGL